MQGGDGRKGRENVFEPFDEFDDEDFEVGREVNLVIEIKRPAWLTSALQINGESSLFSPDFITTTLKESLQGTFVGVRPVQTYFIDDVYRPNPTEYFPTSELLQFTMYKIPNQMD